MSELIRDRCSDKEKQKEQVGGGKQVKRKQTSLARQQVLDGQKKAKLPGDLDDATGTAHTQMTVDSWQVRDKLLIKQAPPNISTWSIRKRAGRETQLIQYCCDDMVFAIAKLRPCSFCPLHHSVFKPQKDAKKQALPALQATALWTLVNGC